MNIKSLIVSLILCTVTINSYYAFPMHVDTYRAKNRSSWISKKKRKGESWRR